MKIIVDGIGEKRLDGRMFVAKGGEGSIYVSQGVAYKICEPGKAIPESKIAELAVLTDPRIIKPERLIYNDRQQQIGYTMRAVKAPWTPCHVFPRDFMTDNKLTHDDIAVWALKLREIVSHAHQHDILLVDLNELNFLLDRNEVFAIDVNSWQTKSFPATAIMDSIRDRQNASFSTGTDWFSWGIVTFQMFVGMHPYKGAHPDFKGSVVERMDARMRANVSVFHAKAKPLAACDSLGVIPRRLWDWYHATFEHGIRETPPTRFDQPAFTIAKTVTSVLSSGDVTIEEFMTCPSHIARIYAEGEKMAILLRDGSAMIDGHHIRRSEPLSKLHYDLMRGQWLAVSGRNLVSLDGTFSRDIGHLDQTFVGARGGLYGILNGRLMNVGPIGEAHVANILDVPNAVFQDDGFVLQNLLGRWHLVYQKSVREFIACPIAELDGFRPIKGRMADGTLIVSGEQRGESVRFEFQFDANGDYDCREFRGISSVDFTFSVNAAGVCVLIDGDDFVCAFKTGRGSQNRRILADAPIDRSFRLWSAGTKILATRDNKVFRISAGK